MLEIRGLRFAYGGRPVLDGVSFTLADGGLCALIGPNGAGKTTLMRCVLGLEPRYEGSVQLDGREARGMKPGELARLMAYIPQRHYPAFNYTALEMTIMGAASQTAPGRSPGEAHRRAALEALERMGVGALAGRGYMELSGGEQQLVLIARALCQRARLLVMDEPTASLDLGNQRRVLDTARALAREGYGVLMSTHQPQQALDCAGRVLALGGGRLLADGDPRAVLDAATLTALYGVPVRVCQTDAGPVIAGDAGPGGAGEPDGAARSAGPGGAGP